MKTTKKRKTKKKTKTAKKRKTKKKTKTAKKKKKKTVGPRHFFQKELEGDVPYIPVEAGPRLRWSAALNQWHDRIRPTG